MDKEKRIKLSNFLLPILQNSRHIVGSLIYEIIHDRYQGNIRISLRYHRDNIEHHHDDRRSPLSLAYTATMQDTKRKKGINADLLAYNLAINAPLILCHTLKMAPGMVASG